MKDQKFKRILFLLSVIHKTDPSLFFLIIANSLLAAITPYISIFTFKFITDAIIARESFNRILVILTTSIISLFIISIINAILSNKVDIKLIMTNTILDKKISTNIRDIEFKNTTNSDLSSLITRIDQVRLRYGGLISLIGVIQVMINTIITFIIASIVLVYTLSNGEFIFLYNEVIVFFIFILLLALFIRRIRYFQERQLKIINKISNEINDTNKSMIGYIQFIFNPGVGKDIRLFDLSRYFTDSIISLGDSEKGVKEFINLSKEEVKSPLMTSLGRNVFLALIYIYSLYKAITHNFNVGKLFVLINTLNNLMVTIIDFIDCYGELTNKIEIFTPFFEALTLNLGNNDDSKITIESIDKIEVRNLSFAYPETDNFVLNDINMTINSKEKIGIVGLNGSGKSTLIKLICGFYKPQKGEILINGINLENIDLDNFREKLSPMFQDFSLLPFTIRENISFKDTISEETEKIFEDRFSSNMNKNLDSYIYKEYSENGIEFSGGELQKIALIRAMNKQASCFIMDEPASFLDPKFEDEMTNLFTEIKNEFIIIQISHRLYSFKECDNIYVIDKGSVVEEGTHSDLIEKNSLYKKLWDMQARLYC